MEFVMLNRPISRTMYMHMYKGEGGREGGREGKIDLLY